MFWKIKPSYFFVGRKPSLKKGITLNDGDNYFEDAQTEGHYFYFGQNGNRFILYYRTFQINWVCTVENKKDFRRTISHILILQLANLVNRIQPFDVKPFPLPQIPYTRGTEPVDGLNSTLSFPSLFAKIIIPQNGNDPYWHYGWNETSPHKAQGITPYSQMRKPFIAFVNTIFDK